MSVVFYEFIVHHHPKITFEWNIFMAILLHLAQVFSCAARFSEDTTMFEASTGEWCFSIW